ncbi:MAG: hypothetical protein A2Y17_02155 [Clostridiales bacterium GWF2_38_85]|nr:MAG: hypothetical protein A2Y17_02155 [Clostridiales bacterium GWF2_38_85]HBL85115.1 hypothetical protein [Clostridiales bacterium]
MKKKLALILSLTLIFALTVIPAQAADTVINLIDESNATWTNNDANSNSVSTDFSDDKLVATAPGSWPWISSVLNEAIVLTEEDDAKLNIKFKVEDATACTSIRLISGADTIYVHHFIPDATYDGAGDITTGEYELSIDVFDLKMYNGTAADLYLGTKDLVLNDSDELIIDGIQVWCSGASTDITVTVEKFEIVIPGGATEESQTGETTIANLAAGKSYTLKGLYADANDAIPYPDESGKDLTDGLKAEEAAYSNAAFVGLNFNAADMLPDECQISEVVVDLGAKETLTSFAVQTLTDSGVGITAPSNIKVSVSDNGTDWTEVGDLAYDNADTSATALYMAELDAATEGQYVKFEFTHVSSWVFVSEVEVYGETEGTTPPPTGDNGYVGFTIIALVSLAGAAIVVSKKRA